MEIDQQVRAMAPGLTPEVFRRRYAVVGLGVTNPIGRSEGRYSARAFQAEAARLAIEDAGLDPQDIDGAINARGEGGGGGNGTWTDAFPRVLGLPVKLYWHVGRGGSPATIGFTAAAMALELGLCKYVVVAVGADGWSGRHNVPRGEEAQNRPGRWGAWAGDVTAMSHHAFFATRHMHEYGTKSEHFGAIAVQIRDWACRNPEASMYSRGPISMEDYLNSRWVVKPYHLLDCCQQSDGGIAYVLTMADRARDLKHDPIWVMGVGYGDHMRSLWWEKKNYTALDVAAARDDAFRLAGIELKDIDIAEMYDCFTAEVLFQLEGYGWCAQGEGGPFVASGAIGPGGSIPVNTGGGLLSGYHLFDFTGFAEGVRQLRRDPQCADRQVAGAEVCLVTGHGGEILRPGMCSTHSSLILGR